MVVPVFNVQKTDQGATFNHLLFRDIFFPNVYSDDLAYCDGMRCVKLHLIEKAHDLKMRLDSRLERGACPSMVV
jgi:hypothetical protein